MTSTLSPGGLNQVWRFWAEVEVPMGRSYQDAIYEHRHDPAALVENARALIEGIAKLQAHVRKIAGGRKVSWQTGGGRKLPGNLRSLLKSVVKCGAKGLDHHDFAVKWTDAKGEQNAYLLDLGDFFWFIGEESSLPSRAERRESRLSVALGVIDEHFACDKRK